MTIKNGNIVIRLAKDAPAPITTNNEGRAQHINVEDEANKDKKFTDLSCISIYRLITSMSVAF